MKILPDYSPKGMVLRAGLLVAAFAVFHLLGLRAYTAFLCGTQPVLFGSTDLAAICGLVYALLWIGTTVVAPVLLIAAGLVSLARHR